MSAGEISLVSVVVPAYNAGRYLGAAIESILAQEYRPLEVIVVDDGSDDDTAAVARAYEPAVRLIAGAHAGPGAARNRGIAAARGAYLAFLDADDLWPSGKLEHQMERLRADSSLDYVLGQAVEFRSETEGRVMAGAVAGAMLIRTEAFHRVGLLRTDLRVGEFIDWFARARELGLRNEVLPKVVLRRRIHTSNTGIRERAGRADYAEVVRAALARRRGMS